MNRRTETPELLPTAHALDRQAAGTFLFYLALSLLFFGRGLAGQFSSSHIGTGPDVSLIIWLLAWWAHALTHHLNPFMPRAVFAPLGVNLAWAAVGPAVMLAGLPLTVTVGPVVAYNVLMLLAPALAGWAAFVLCRYLARSYWPAWLGGWVFGFSPYMLGAMLGHLHVAMVFPIPLIVWIVLRRVAGEMSIGRFVAAIALLLAVQFSCFPEGFATATVLGAMALGLALLFTASDTRGRLWALVAPLAAAYALSAVLLSPLLYFMFAHGFPRGVIFSPWLFSADLLGLIVPTPLIELGRLHLFTAITTRFRTGLAEAGSTVALPLIVIAVLYARKKWWTPAGRLLVDMLVILCVLSMGSRLEIAGRITLGLPWWVLGRLPMLQKALPARLSIYVFLLLAIIAALWLSTTDASRWRRWILGAAVVPFSLPALAGDYWVRPVGLPPFFSTAAYRNYLAAGETVLVLPFGWRGEDMLWQASTDFYFNLAGGYVGYAPLLPGEYARWPITQGLYEMAGVPGAGEQLKAFLAHHGVGAILVGNYRFELTRFYDGPSLDVPARVPLGPRERREINQCLGSLGVAPLEVGGVTLYRLAPQTLAPYRDLSALGMQRRADRARFEALLRAGQRYMADGRDPAALTPQAVEALGMVPLDWFGGEPFPVASPNPIFHTGSMLRWRYGEIVVGVEGGGTAFKALIARYGADATAVYFPYPARLSPTAEPASNVAMMVMTFDRSGLARAAAQVSARP